MNFVIFIFLIFSLISLTLANPNANWDFLKCSGNNMVFVQDNKIVEGVTIKELADIRQSVVDNFDNAVIVSGTGLNGKSVISKISFLSNFSYTFQAIVIESVIKDMNYDWKTKDLFWFNGTSLKMKTIDSSISSTTNVFQLQNILSMKIHTNKNDLYWIEKSNRKQIKRINIKNYKSKTDVALVYEGSSIINSIDIDYMQECLYWIEKNGIYFNIKKREFSSGCVTSIYNGTNNNPAKLKTIDENVMFWISDLKLYQFAKGHGYRKLFDSDLSDFSANKRALFEQARLIGARNNAPNRAVKMPCAKTCLNKGECGFNSNFTEICKCSDAFYGEFCQFRIDIPKLCVALCQLQTFDGDDQLFTFCNCQANKTVIMSALINRTLEMLKAVLLKNDDLPLRDTNSSYDNYYADKIITILSLTIVVMFLVIVLMAFKVFCLKTNTRVHKRYLINKNNSKHPDGQTEHCEIEIENCCNMNICETPCFEPLQLKSVNGAMKKVEDKRKLINNMEH